MNGRQEASTSACQVLHLPGPRLSVGTKAIHLPSTFSSLALKSRRRPHPLPTPG